MHDLTTWTTAELKAAVGYQRYVPEHGTTYGPCDQECGRAARGGRVCENCLLQELIRRAAAIPEKAQRT